MLLAEEAGERHVSRNGFAAMRAGHDMIDLKGQIIEALRHSTVFADRTGPAPNKFFQIAVHR